MTGLFDVIAVGGGPAGSAAATVLAQAGRSVLLLEKDRFPRAKVCGEFLSADASASLERLGLRESVERLGAETIVRGSIHPPAGASVSFCLPAPALGISRFLFDDLLARRAAQAGADVRFGARVVSVEKVAPDRFRVRAVQAQNEIELESGIVVGAWGRWNALDRSLERAFVRRRSRFFGWSRDYGGENRSLAEQVRLYLFPGGYCGLSRVEGGTVNLAGIVSESMLRRAGTSWEAICRHARESNASLDTDLSAFEPGPVGFLGTGPVFFTTKPSVENGILMAGDAAGVIDPFSGQGQASALASGILAGETIEDGLSAGLSTDQIARVYARVWKLSFKRRFRSSRLLRLLMLHPTLGSLAGRLAGERLVRFGISATPVARSPDFLKSPRPLRRE